MTRQSRFNKIVQPSRVTINLTEVYDLNVILVYISHVLTIVISLAAVTMKVSIVVLGVLAACAVSLAVEQGPLLTALQPTAREVELVQPDAHIRSKRHGLLLG